MKRRLIAGGMGLGLFVLIGVLGTGPSLAEGAVCDPDGSIVDPQPFVWTPEGDHFVGVLEYGEATFTVDGETLRTRAYRQAGGCYSIPGPTIDMTPGNTYVLRFRNLLPTNRRVRPTTTSRTPTSRTCTHTGCTSPVRAPATT